MQKHEPRIGYTELRLDPCLLPVLCLAGPGLWKKAFLGFPGAVARPLRGTGEEDGAVLVCFCAVLCCAEPP